MNTRNERTPHILNTSSNLLGICLIILTSLRLLKTSDKSIIDEITILSSLLFMTSCILSFLSMNGKDDPHNRLERVADITFLGGLSLLFVTITLFSLNIIQ